MNSKSAENKRPNPDSGYKNAQILASSHYENFPVAGLLIPKNLRQDVAIIYWFARTADDLADENEFPAEHRMEALDAFEERFHALMNGAYQNDFEAALHATIQSRNLTPELFLALLTAFRQDVVKKRYATMHELMDYCSRSANPVGRLLLELYGIRDAAAAERSDAICTALQLTNFWQDVSVDILKGRIYVPQDYMEEYGVTVEMFHRKGDTSAELRLCMAELISYTETLFEKGEGLLPYLSFRFRWEIALTIEGGRKILAKIKKIKYNTVPNRVRLRFHNIFELIIRSFIVCSISRRMP